MFHPFFIRHTDNITHEFDSAKDIETSADWIGMSMTHALRRAVTTGQQSPDTVVRNAWKPSFGMIRVAVPTVLLANYSRRYASRNSNI